MALPILGRLATPPGPYSFASGKGPETRNRRNDQLDQPKETARKLERDLCV